MQAAVSSILALCIFFYVKSDLEFKEYKNNKQRNIISGALSAAGVIAFGLFCGFTGFLRS
jgi:hypothetical protein